MGYLVFTVDRNPHAPAYQFADEYKVIDICDREGVLAYAREIKADGVMPINDFGLRAACYVSQEMNLVGNSMLTGICSNDKGIMRDVWKSENLSQPDYLIIKNDKKELKRVLQSLKFPLVIKPTDCGGAARGVSIARKKKELVESFDYAIPFAANNRIIVEEYIEGIDMTIDALSYEGRVHILSMSDKVKPSQKYRVATALNFPAALPEKTLEKVRTLVKKAVLTLGITNGASHTEVIVQKNGEPKLLELGARGGGGHIFHTIVKESRGINYAQEFAKILCREKPNLKITKNKGVVYRFFNPPIGIIEDIKVPGNVFDLPFVVDFGITAKIGQKFEGLKDSMHRVGFVVTRGNDREEAIKNADYVESLFEFIVKK